MRRIFLLPLALLCSLSASVAAKPPQLQSARIARLRADLAGPESATQILTRWCAASGLASPPVIKALPVPGAAKKPSAQIRASLKASPGQAVRYRRVQLMCGRQVFSEADNWYLPDRLTAAMNHTLDTTDTSFGTVVRPLNFHRQTIAVSGDPGPRFVLHVRALLVSGTGDPFSLVVENYRRTLVSR